MENKEEEHTKEKQEIEKFLRNIKPRDYQWNIFKTTARKNTLVILPTGTGKTLIALMLAIERLIKYPQSRILFLAPTKPLAEQHYNYFIKHLPQLFATLVLFTGKVKAEKRKKIWEKAEIIFSTPQCVSNDLKKELYSLKEVSLLIEDECHRCVKNYAYTFVVKKYKEQGENIRVLGLTASPGHEKEKIKKICENLGIKAVEIRTRESKDVKPYLQKLKFKIIKLDFPKELEGLRDSLKEIFDKKIEELKKRKLLFEKPTKKNLLELQKQITKAIASGNRHFNLLSGASACAIAIKIQHALELLETQTLSALQNYFQELFKQAEQEKSKAVKQLVRKVEFNKVYVLLTELIAKGKEHPKLMKLKETLEEELKKNPELKVIVFAQYRDTVVRICKELNSLRKVNARVFVGQTKKISGLIEKEETGLSQKEQQELIREFSLGKINILVATSIAEEGLDLPEINLVVFYEPIPSAIRQIQRRGRTARLMPGKLLILITKNTRDENYYWAAFHKERKMYKEIDNINKEFREEKKKKTLLDFG